MARRASPDSRRTAASALPPLAALLALALLPATPIDARRPIDADVRIRRDDVGVPHVRAASIEGAAFGLGFAQAEDHPLVLARRVLETRGTAARVFGPEALEGDIAAHRADNLGAARRALHGLDGEYRRVLQAFAAGANRYYAGHRGDLPSWVPELTEADLVAASRGDAVDQAFSGSLARALAAKYPAAGAPRDAVPPAARWLRVPVGEPDVEGSRDAEAGSNALALAGSRTASGKPILLGNPHLRWTATYWEAHLTVPGRLDFYGSTLVGLPWLRAGFNDTLGYVQTNNAPDYQDVYALPADPARPDHFLEAGRSRPLARREVIVEVRQADGSLAAERRTHWDTPLGPVVHRTAERVFVLRSQGLGWWRHLEGFVRLSQARSLRDYEAVLRRGLFFTSNFTYADAAGNILYQWNTRLPRRRDPTVDYTIDVPFERRTEWTGIHPLSDLPRLLNPPGGAVQNANNSPWYTSRRDAPDPARYPPYIERRPLDLRPQQALRLLDAHNRFTTDDVVALKFENRMLLAERVRPALLAAAGRVGAPSADLARGRIVLAAWDGTVNADSRGGVLFERFWSTYRAAVRAPFAEPWDAARPFDTPRGLADPDAAVRHLEEAVAWTRAKWGAEDVAWGEVHRFRAGALDLPGDGAAGALGLYRVMTFHPAPDGRLVAGRVPGIADALGSGDAWVLLVHFTQPVQAWSVLAYGQSSREGSPHGSDQLRLFADHRLRPVRFAEADIAAHTTRDYAPH
jgi:acyl-homoserine-lactone acylase